MKKLAFLLMLLIATPVLAADWTIASPLAGDSVSAWPAANLANMTFLDRLLSYYREGMAISYSSASAVSVAAGEITCTNSGTSAHVFRQNNTATSVGWSDIDTGSEAPSTTYYVYANCDASATTATFKLSASATTPTGVTTFRRLGSFYNNSSNDITTITNDNDQKKFGSYALKSVGANYQASTDGFVVAYSQCANGGSAVGSLNGYTDSNSAPSTLVSISEIYYSPGSGGGSGPGSGYPNVTFPVKAGDYYRVDQSASYYYGGSCSNTMNFVPIN